jgi:hypothetical protein
MVADLTYFLSTFPHLRYNPRHSLLTFIKTEPMMNPRTGTRLYPQDLDAIHGLARAGFLSADQLRRHFYPQ